MERTPIIFSVLLFLISTAVAVNVDADFDTILSGYYFNTDLSFTTDMTLAADAANVVDGDPSDLQNGDTVCSGATLTVFPVTTSKWAVSSLSVKSIYPECSVGYCPPMEAGGSVSYNKNIKWLSSGIFDEHDSFGDSSGFTYDYTSSFAQDKYADLGTFYDQPVKYVNSSGTYNDKEAGANVFCKGTMQVRDGSTVKTSLGLPYVMFGGVDFTVNSAGSHAISTRLTDTECFGAIVKHPLNTGDHKDFFRIYYFTENQPSISDATKTITINVQPASGTCDMHETNVVATSSLLSEDIIMLKTTIQNDGSTGIKVTDVSGNNPDYTVEPFPTSMCIDLGFPSSLCPSSNGFDQEIYPVLFDSRNLYVFIYRAPGASGSLTITFNAETMDDTCGGATCSEQVSLTGPITCEIDPTSLTYGTLEVAEFLVTCRNLGGYVTPCIGDDWYWAGGLDGDFVEKDNTHALAYPTSPPGSSGTLRYESGIALCLSEIDVVEPTYVCEFIPPSAELNFSQSQDFAFNCTVDDTPHQPDSTDYDLIDGLDGSTSGETTDGVTYDAPDDATDGQLSGFGHFDDAPSPILGAIAFAQINVVNGTGGMNDTNDTNDTGYNDDGSSIWCTIGGNGPLTVFPGFSGWVGIQCGPDANETCDDVEWSMEPPEAGSLTGSDTNGTYYSITGEPGDSGEIWAIVTPGGDGCYKPFTIMEPWCWEFS
jgi:hypothetical protein